VDVLGRPQGDGAGQTLGTFAIAGGWGEGPRCFRHLVPEFLTAGYRTLCLKSARFGGGRRDRLRHKYPWAQLRLARGVNRQLAAAGNGRVIGVAHSMSGVYMTLAAMLRPDQFEAIVLLAPSGLLENDTFWGMVNRLNKKVLHSIIMAWHYPNLRRATWVSLREGFLYALANPLRAVQEASSLTAAFTRPWIAELRSRGVKVYLLRASDDVIYPPTMEPWLRDELDGSEVLNGCQHDLWFYPERLAREILSLISSATTAPGGVSQ
jgi:pimeloyl-ACP methyl ester carboxylesterase